MSQPPLFCELSLAGQPTRIEYAWMGNTDPAAPLMVFLHEGLGSLSMWRDFPARLCEVLGWRGLVYSRPGYGQSTPRPAAEHWQPDFMHRQALINISVHDSLRRVWPGNGPRETRLAGDITQCLAISGPG